MAMTLIAGMATIANTDRRPTSNAKAVKSWQKMIAPVAPSRSSRSTGSGPLDATAPAAVEPAAPLDYAAFTAALTQMISTELGLRGFVLTLAVEKASTIEELRAVADRTLTQIAERKGEARAAAARRALYGG